MAISQGLSSRILQSGIISLRWILVLALMGALLTACGAPVTEPETIVVIGDSLVSGGKLFRYEDHESTIKGGWVTRLQSRLDEDFPGEYQTVNMGYSGIGALGVLAEIPSAIEQNPAIMLIQVGGNDFYGSYSEDSFETKLDSFQLQIEQIIEKIQQDSPETHIYLVGYPLNVIKKYAEQTYSVKYDEQEVVDDRYQRFNDTLESLAGENGIDFINILDSWPKDVEERWALSADGVHPDDDGYDLLTEIIYTAMYENLLSE